MQKSDTLIRTKLRLPFTRPELVQRPRLSDQIRQGLRGPLTLITAPAGFGKTTLLASCVADAGVPIAWLSLDKDDNQAGRFLKYLVAAVQETDPSTGRQAAQLLAASQQTPPEAILIRLINDLDAAQNDIVLVLDDYQFIKNQDVHTAVAFLLDYCPGTLHLVIASRSDPPLPIARLRARGQVVELRTADLRFTGAEAAQFLNEVMGLDLDTQAIVVLAERTEGWIAGLQMAALSMRDREDVLSFIDSFSGTHRYILDYLLEEVLANQSAEVQRFLLYTSILEQLSAPLCDAVLGGEEPDDISGAIGLATPAALRSKPLSPAPDSTSHEILEHLDRANLFLVSLDEKRHWYRYHHLFADLLRAQLQNTLAEHERQWLHLRASRWYEQNGFTLEAIHHASLASDFERIERLIEQNYLEMLNRGEMSAIRFWMGKLSKELVYRRPWLCLYEAFSRSWFGQLEEANLLLNEAEKRIHSEGSTPETEAMLGYHAYVRSRVTAMQGDTHRAIEFCLEAREKVPADNLGMQIEVGITLGYEYFLMGDFVNASQTLQAMIQKCFTVRAINNPVAAYALLARLQAVQGGLHAAYDLFQKAAQLIREADGQYLGATGLVEVGTAALLCEWNDVQAALLRIQAGLDLLPAWGKADDLCLAYTTLVRIQLALGNLAEAAAALEKAAQLIQACGVFSEARSAVETTQVNLWLVQGEKLAIDRWAEGLENRSGAPTPYRFEDEPEQITWGRVLIAQNKAQQAIRLLSILEESVRAGGRTGRLIEILTLKALALQAGGDASQAKHTLTECLELAEPEGYLRVFLDEGQPMQQLLAVWLDGTNANPLWYYARQILAEFEVEPQTVTALQEKTFPSASRVDLEFRLAEDTLVEAEERQGETVLVEALSPREVEVLQLMAQGKTNKEIARQLVVAPGTVKAHTASIYRKLDVANRTEAAARARQLGLLS